MVTIEKHSAKNKIRVLGIYSDGVIPEDNKADFESRMDDDTTTAIQIALVDKGYDFIGWIPAKDGFVEEIIRRSGTFDVVFNLADEGINLNTQFEPNIVAFLDLLGIKYTGCSHISLTNCLDKVLTKRILKSCGIPTPEFEVFDDEIAFLPEISLKFPVIVKPSKEDGSMGIREDSVIHSPDRLKDKINQIAKKYKQPVLVEEFIEGREMNVGVLGNKHPMSLPVSEIIFNLPSNKIHFLPYSAKWNKGAVYEIGTVANCPADINAALESRLRKISLKCYLLMGLDSYGRVDFRIDEDGNPFVLEVNPNPDISPDAGLANMARKSGMDYPELLDKIVRQALGDDVFHK